MKTVKVFFINILILTGASFFMRLIDVSFQVYLSNKIGASGMGLFQLIMSVYMLAITFATSGIRLATTRLVVEEVSTGGPQGARRVVCHCLRYSVGFGTAAAVILFWKADWISLNWLGDARPALSLKLLAVSLPFISMSASMNGYFTAMRKAAPSAGTQIFEQFVKITLSVIGLALLLPKGLEYACVALVSGSALAEAASFSMLFFLYRRDTRRMTGAASQKHLTRKLLGIALPDAFSSYARSALTTIEHLLIPVGLKKSGATGDAALGAYGMVQGMVLPIITFPTAFLQSMSGLLVPEIAECYARGSQVRLQSMITRVLRMTMLFSVGVMCIFFGFSDELGMAVYQNVEVSFYIQWLAPLILVMYLDTTVDGILKGLGQQVSSMRYNIIDAAVSVVLVWFLLPKIAITGYIITIFTTELLNFVLSARRLVQVAQFKVEIKKGILTPLLCGAAAVVAVKMIVGTTKFHPTLAWMDVTMQIVLAVIMYFLYLWLCSCLTREDLEWARGIFRS